MTSDFKLEPLEVRQKRYKPLFDELQSVLASPQEQILLKPQRLRFFGTDQSFYAPVLPAAVITPYTTEEVAAVVRLCAKHKVPMTPRGSGTGLEGGAVPFAGGVVINTSKLLWMSFDAANSCVWAGAGVKKKALDDEARKYGLLFGPDPASNPCVGGMVATSGSGMSTLRYGTTRENVISLRVVTAEGRIVQTRQVVRKSSAGLELTQLYIGSEGTLGIICEVCFRLFPATKYSAGGYAAFRDTDAAVRSVVALKNRGFPPTLLRCELMNSYIVEATNSYSKMSLPVTATILLEFTGNDWWLRDIKRDYAYIMKVFKEIGSPSVTRYLKPGKEMDDVWEARRMCHFAAMHARGCKQAEKLFGTDICVPIDKLTEIVKFTEDAYAAAKKPCYLCAHITDGNFHLIIPFKDDAELKELQAIEKEMISRAIAMGGTISGEHGIGVGKVHMVEQEHGAAHVDIQESIKKALDRDNLMNPGCFYPFQQRLYPIAHL